MTCDEWNNCVDDRMEKMGYPVDNTALYKDKIYDQQIANGKCYEMNPIRIIESFSGSSWNFWIICIVVVLLIVLIGFVMKDYMGGKENMSGGFTIDTPSAFNLESLKF